jgi:hypothetical protein
VKKELERPTACSILVRAGNISLATVSFHRHYKASDFIGSYRPVGRHGYSENMEKHLFESADGPLVSAIGKGKHCVWMKLTWLMMQSQRDSVLFLTTEKTLLLAER